MYDNKHPADMPQLVTTVLGVLGQEKSQATKLLTKMMWAREGHNITKMLLSLDFETVNNLHWSLHKIKQLA